MTTTDVPPADESTTYDCGDYTITFQHVITVDGVTNRRILSSTCARLMIQLIDDTPTDTGWRWWPGPPIDLDHYVKTGRIRNQGVKA